MTERSERARLSRRDWSLVLENESQMVKKGHREGLPGREMLSGLQSAGHM